MGKPTLTVLVGETAADAPRPARKLQAALARMWADSAEAATRLEALADLEAGNARRKAWVTMQAAFCRAHASRINARLRDAKLPLVPCIAPVPDMAGERREVLLQEAALARAFARRFERIGELARAEADLSTAWVCELNRTEELDRARILTELAHEVTHG